MKTKLHLVSSSPTGVFLSPVWFRFVFVFLLVCYLNSGALAQNQIWDKTLGGSRNDNLTTIIATSDGGYLLGGTSLSGKTGDKTDFNRNGKATEEWQRQDYWVVKVDSRGQ